MTAQMNHTNQRTVTEDRPTTTIVRSAPSGPSTPSRPERPNRRGPRWIGPVVALGAVVAIGGALLVDANSDPSPTPNAEAAVADATRTYWETRSFPSPEVAPSAQVLIDQSIADAIAERQAADASTVAADTPFADGAGPGSNSLNVVPVIPPVGQSTEFTAAQQLVQQSIDEALADQVGQVSTDPFDLAEANRMNTLRDLSAASNLADPCYLGGPC